MFLPSYVEPNFNITYSHVESGLVLIATAFAFLAPRLGARAFARVENLIAPLARRKTLVVWLAGLSTLLLRLAMLPIFPRPLPFCPDDFSFLLSAETFALGRLTNPVPAMWTHLETIHISMLPTYMSMYFPGMGLLMAASKVLLGHPWWAMLGTSALMCAVLTWALQAWLPPTWALLGGAISVVHLGLFSYWTNTYHAAGSIGALAGALILGGLPRIQKRGGFVHALLLALGAAILMLTRPYEGLLLCLPVLVVLVRWILRDKRCPAWPVLLRRAVVPMLLIAAAIAWLGYYNHRAFGKATTMPYTLNRNEYALAPYYIWQKARPEPAYRHTAMKSFYYAGELDYFTELKTAKGFFLLSFGKIWNGIGFFSGAALAIPLIMFGRVRRDRRMRFLLLVVLVMTLGLSIEIYMLPHYLAPFTAAFYVIGLQCMRHLRQWKPEGQPAGIFLTRILTSIVFLMALLRLFPGPLNLNIGEWPASNWNGSWYGPVIYGTERARVAQELEQQPGDQLVLVRHSARHNPFEEWVYNAPSPDSAKVVWAREMDAANNLEVMRYYRNRKVWLVEADKTPAMLTPLDTASTNTAQPGQ